MKLFDALLFIGKPDLTQYGLTPIRLLGDSHLFPAGADRFSLPTEETLSAAVSELHALTVLNVEHWQSIAFYGDLLRRVHQVRPQLRVGYYGLPPKRDYWRALRPADDPQYLVWQAENNGLKPIAEQADVLFPSLYAFYPDEVGWFRYATANIAEARRYNKTLYPFLWPYYHDSSALKGQTLPPDYWRLQLETLKALAVDGIVIWGGYKLPWDEHAPWWLETLRFISTE
jgi:Hyaluronidase